MSGLGIEVNMYDDTMGEKASGEVSTVRPQVVSQGGGRAHLPGMQVHPVGQAKKGTQRREGAMKIPARESMAALMLILVIVTFAPPVHAQSALTSLSPQTHTVSGTCLNNSDPAQRNLSATLTNIQYLVIGIDVIVAGIMLGVWAFWHMAEGATGGEQNPEKKLQQRQRLMQIFVGLLVALLATGLVVVAKNLIVGGPC